MATRALTNLNYIVDQDSSVAFDSPIIDLEHPFVAVNYQIKWDLNVRGEFIWLATIYPDLWENYIACEEVNYRVDGTAEHTIISLPQSWLTAGYLKFEWVPEAGSSGLISVASRIVPT